MSSNWLSRAKTLLGEQAIQKLQNSTVLIAGLGGVGGYALEALCRSGVGHFILIDSDTFEETNLNRQLLCTTQNIGKNKTEIASQRVLSINPNAEVSQHYLRLNSSNIDFFLDMRPTVVVDAIDSVESKCFLLQRCVEKNITVVSSMGAALRQEPTLVRTADISKTSSDPLAKVVRGKLKEKGITEGIDCVYSLEKPSKLIDKELGSLVSVTGTFGLVLSQLAINKIIR